MRAVQASQLAEKLEVCGSGDRWSPSAVLPIQVLCAISPVRVCGGSTFTKSLEVGKSSDGLLLSAFLAAVPKPNAHGVGSRERNRRKNGLEVLVAIPWKVQRTERIRPGNWICCSGFSEYARTSGGSLRARELRSRLSVVEGRCIQIVNTYSRRTSFAPALPRVSSVFFDRQIGIKNKSDTRQLFLSVYVILCTRTRPSSG